MLGSIVVLSAALAAYFALQIVAFEPDELGYTRLAIGISHSLTPFTQSYGGAERLNQLYPLLIAPLWGTFGTVDAFRLTHVWNAVLMASTTIPSYLLARELGVRRPAAYLVAGVVAVVPWMTLATSELTEVAAFPACAWALLAMQRALVAPSVKRDLIAILAIVIASYARLQLVVLAPVFVVAVLVHELGYAFRSRDERPVSIGRTLRRIAHEHTVLTVAATAGIVAGVPLLATGTLASAAGFYGDTLNGASLGGATLDLARTYFVFVALGLGAIPAALTCGFVLETLVAPSSRRAHAFATVTLVTVVALALQVAEVSVRFNSGTMQERYAFYIAPLLAVGMAAGLLTSRHRLRVIAIGSLALAVLVATTHYESARTAFWYQVSPAMTTVYDLFLPAFGARGSLSTAGGASGLPALGLAVLGLGAIVGVLVWRFAAARVLVAVGAAAIVLCGAETTYALWHVVHGSASGPGLGAGSLKRVDWVSRSAPSGESVAELVGNVGGLASSNALWETNAFWNRSIAQAFTLDSFIDPYLPTKGVGVDAATGAIVSGTARRSVSERYLVLPARGYPVVPEGTVLARSPDKLLELMRAATPATAVWAVGGISSDGWLRLGQPLVVRLYALRGRPGSCDTVGLTLSVGSVVSEARRLTLTRGRAGRTVNLPANAVTTIDQRVCGRPGAVPQVSASLQPPALSDQPELSAQLTRVTVTPS